MRITAFRFALPLLCAGLAARADPPVDVPRADSLTRRGLDKSALNEAPKFYGLSLNLTVGDGSGLNSVGENYNNQLALFVEPKWAIGDVYFRGTRFQSLLLQGYWALTYSLHGLDPASFGSSANAGPETPCGSFVPSTNGGQVNPSQVPYCNPVTNSRRADPSDIRLTLKNPAIYTVPKLDLDINPSLRLYLPTSLESQYQTLRTAIMTSVGLSRRFWADKLTTAAGLGFTKNFFEYTTPGIFANQSGSASAQGSNPFDGLSGVGLSNFFSDPSRMGPINGYNVNYQWTASADVTWTINDKWSIDVLYLYLSGVPYDHSCVVTTEGMSVDTCQTGNAVAANSGTTVLRPGHHDTEIFWATVSYQLEDWVSLNLAWINWAPALYPDSTFRQPFISTNYDEFTTVQLSATFSVDQIAARKF